MVVRIQLQSHGFRAELRSPQAGKSNEKALVGAESIHHGRRCLTGERSSIRLIRNRNSVQIAQRFPEDLLPVVVQAATHVQRIELVGHTRRSRFKLPPVICSPPVIQSAVPVELRPTVVELMSYLVTDH